MKICKGWNNLNKQLERVHNIIESDLSPIKRLRVRYTEGLSDYLAIFLIPKKHLNLTEVFNIIIIRQTFLGKFSVNWIF